MNKELHFNYCKIHSAQIYDTFTNDLHAELKAITGLMSQQNLTCSLADNAKTASEIIDDEFVRRISSTGVCVRVCVRACVRACMYVCVCVCVCVCVHSRAWS